jgi:hypothetical protein
VDDLKQTVALELERLFALYWMRDNGIERVDREPHTPAIDRQFNVWFEAVRCLGAA